MNSEKIVQHKGYRINYGPNEVPIDIAKVESKYQAKYVGNFCLPTVGGGWGEQPVAIFYQENPPPIAQSNYFGLFDRGSHLLITDGAKAMPETGIDAIVSEDGEVLFSRYRHDFRTSKDKTVSIDGGRDYTKLSYEPGNSVRTVTLRLEKDQLVVA